MGMLLSEQRAVFSVGLWPSFTWEGREFVTERATRHPVLGVEPPKFIKSGLQINHRGSNINRYSANCHNFSMLGI